MVFPACPSADACVIHVAFNSQIQLCSQSDAGDERHCRNSRSLCSPDNSFKFSFEEGDGVRSSFKPLRTMAHHVARRIRTS